MPDDMSRANLPRILMASVISGNRRLYRRWQQSHSKCAIRCFRVLGPDVLAC